MQEKAQKKSRKLIDLTQYRSCQLWLDSFKSPATKVSYCKHLQFFCKFYNTTPDKLLEKQDKKLEDMIVQYLIHMKRVALTSTGKPIKGRLNVNTIGNYIFGVRHFLKFNRRHKKIDWELIIDMMPEKSRTKWRPYTREEILKILAVADMRQKVMFMLPTSGGMRVGALSDLRFKDIKPLDNGLGLVTVYPDSAEDHYYTFITAECMAAIETYKSWRIAQHEKITPDSYVIRDKFMPFSYKVNRPRRMKPHSIMIEVKRLVRKALPLEVTEVIQTDHGFRKYFNTACKNCRVEKDFKELMMGHDTGLDEIYYDEDNEISRNEVMAEYLKAADALTITDEFRQKKQVESMKEELANAAPKDLVADLTITSRALQGRLEKVEIDNDKLRKNNEKLMRFVEGVMKGEIKPDQNPRG